MQRAIAAVIFVACLATVGHAQTPRPFPGSTAQPARPAPPPAPPTSSTAPAAAAPQAQRPADPNAPSAATLGVAVYPGAQFLASYQAGQFGQRFYLFGTTATFAEVVGYYQTQITEKGDVVYKDPPTHWFTGGTLAKYKEETMAFPPSVTVKDWTSGGLAGYPNPKLGAQPARFPTIVMIVPAPPGTPSR